MKQSAMLGSLVAAGRLPLLRADAVPDTGIDAQTGPAAVKPVRPYLSSFRTAKGAAVKEEDYTLTFDIVHWNWTNARSKRHQPTNRVVGSLVVTRRNRSRDVTYQVLQKTNFGDVQNVIDAQIVCETDALNTLRSWTIRTFGQVEAAANVPLSDMRETGRNLAGRIRIDSGMSHYGFVTRRDVVSQWTVFDFLMRRAETSSSMSFDLLQDLALFKPGQTLIHDGRIEVPVRDHAMVTLDGFAQTGEGILPRHYLLDAQHRPQLVTGSLVSWALTDVS